MHHRTPGPEGHDVPAPEAASTPGRRAPALIAIGTLFSRATGLGRTLAVALCLGTGLVADGYNLSNQLPTILFILFGGGAIASAFTPLLIRAAHQSSEQAARLGAALFFGALSASVIVTLLLLAFSPNLFKALAGTEWPSDQLQLVLRLAYFCLPQLVLLSAFTILSQIANSRDRFTVVAWAPATANVFLITLFLAIAAGNDIEANNPSSLSWLLLLLIGAGTLASSMIQIVPVAISLMRSGYRFRYRGLRGLGLRSAARIGLISVLASAGFQLASLATTVFSTRAGAQAQSEGSPGTGYTAFLLAQTVILAVQAVINTGTATVLLNLLSRANAERRAEDADRALVRAVTATFAVTLPIMPLMITVAPWVLSRLISRGMSVSPEGLYVAEVLIVMSAGLIPYALQILLLRPHYAVARPRAALESSAVVTLAWIGGAAACYALMPSKAVTLGCAAAFSLAYWLDLPLAFRRLRRLGLSPLPKDLKIAIVFAVLCSLLTGGSALLLGVIVPHPAWLGPLAGIIAFLLYSLVTQRTRFSLTRWKEWSALE